jgi:hypothetical protein
MLLDFDRAVTGLSSQPFRLSWDAANGVRRGHVPDFFARLADGTGVVVDVRADDRIGPRSSCQLNPPFGYTQHHPATLRI